MVRHLNPSLPLQAIRTIVLDDPIALPVNYSKIAPLVPNSIPAQNEFIPIDQYRLSNKAAKTNLKLWWDYLDIIYPRGEYPRDESKVLKVRARGYSIELVDIVPAQ